MGGAGIYPTQALPADTCELVKMYLTPTSRGKGIAGRLLQHCFDAALANGFDQVYIETLPELARAIQLYEQAGFEYLNEPLGQSGHTDCTIWMLKKLR